MWVGCRLIKSSVGTRDCWESVLTPILCGGKGIASLILFIGQKYRAKQSWSKAGPESASAQFLAYTVNLYTESLLYSIMQVHSCVSSLIKLVKVFRITD